MDTTSTKTETIIWIDLDIAPIDTPKDVTIRLVGTYLPQTNNYAIHIIIQWRGTEYRLERLYKNAYITNGDITNILKARTRKMISLFTDKYKYMPFAKFLDTILGWSNNTSHQVLCQLVRN